MTTHVAALRYFEYGLMEVSASSVIIDWNWVPDPSNPRYDIYMRDFVEWIYETYEGTKFEVQRYGVFEWHVHFPGDTNHANLILFKLKWDSQVTV